MAMFEPDDGAKTTVFAGGSRTVLNFVHAAKTRRKWLAVGAGVSVLVAGAAAFGYARYAQSQAATRVVDGYSSMSRCLLGEPLASGERPSVRFRGLQLAGLAGADAARSKKEPPWPDRCAVYGHQLHAGLKATSLAEDKGKALVASSQALATRLEAKDAYFQDLTKEIDTFFTDAATAGIAMVAKPDVAAPEMKKATPLTIDELVQSGPITAKPHELDRVQVPPHADLAVHFLVTSGDPKAPMVCSISKDKGRCTTLPKAVQDAQAGGLSLLGSADDGAAPLVFAGKNGSDGAFRSDTGDKLGAGTVIGAHVAADGAAKVLVDDGRRITLLRTDGKKVVKGIANPGKGLKVGAPSQHVRMLGGHAVYFGTKAKKLMLGAADPGKRGLDPMDLIGEVPPPKRAKAELRLVGCRSSKAVFAQAEAGRAGVATFWLGSRWSDPVALTSTGGLPSCSGNEATIVRVDKAGGDSVLTHAIGVQRCGPSKCTAKTVRLGEMLTGEQGLAPAPLMVAGGVAGKLAVVWQAGQRGGLRMRLGSADQIGKLPDVILLDDLQEGGAVRPGSTLVDMKLLPAEDFAVLLLNTSKGLFALRILGDGSAKPVKVEKG